MEGRSSGPDVSEQHDHAAARLPLAFDGLIPLAALAQRAVVISRLLNHPVYDCFYLALAEERSAKLMTAISAFSIASWARGGRVSR